MKVFIFSLGILFALLATATHASTLAEDCVTVETKDGFTLLTNKCSKSITLTWFYEGVCKEGCSKKMAPKAYFYEILFKEPYTIGGCYSPENVDPQWKGIGPVMCK